jgi:hypothetical protein
MTKPWNPADAIIITTRAVTKAWAKQRKAEERNANAVSNRCMRLTPSTRITLRDAAFSVMEDAYMAASDGNTLPAKGRQIMYRARPRSWR